MAKSTLLEGIATLSGFDEAGGAGGYKPVDHSDAIEVMGGKLSSALCAGWLPKVSNGWFFRAESFFSVARYLDKVQSEFIPGVGTGRPHRTSSRIPTVRLPSVLPGALPATGIFIFDEPELALSPSRQTEFLKLLRRMDESRICQVIMATHSSMLMAYPQARLLRLSKYGLEQVTVRETDHYKVMREFCEDLEGFAQAAIEE